jgi:hypothetical protein
MERQRRRHQQRTIQPISTDELHLLILYRCLPIRERINQGCKVGKMELALLDAVDWATVTKEHIEAAIAWGKVFDANGGVLT